MKLVAEGFTVRLLGNHIKLAQLETQTMMILDPFPPLSTTVARADGDAKAKKCQYESIFMQLADENRYAKKNCNKCLLRPTIGGRQ